MYLGIMDCCWGRLLALPSAKAKDIVFRLIIIEYIYSSLMDFGL
jgi:hypothetical protein